MILKKSDDKSNQIQALETLLNIAQGDKKTKIQKELNFLRAGIKGEKDTTYHIDFNLRDSENYVVLHDLRLEINGNVAQIDHLLINRTLRIYCVETKHFNSGIKINDDGEFMQWNAYKKTYEGIPSPIAQNQRHITVLDDVFNLLIEPAQKLVFILYPSFHSRIAVNNDAKIERSSKFNSQELVKSEQLYESIKKDFEDLGTSIGALLNLVSYKEIENIGKKLIELHKPINIDYRAKFGIVENEKSSSKAFKSEKVEEVISNTAASYISEIDHKCKKCNSQNIKILYGKFGYYFKCSDCDGNTNIKVECGIQGHSAKLRKDGNKFYLDCPECKSSKLYFEN